MHRFNDLALTPLTHEEDTFHSWRPSWLTDLVYHQSVTNQPWAEWHHCFENKKDFSAKIESRGFFPGDYIGAGRGGGTEFAK